MYNWQKNAKTAWWLKTMIFKCKTFLSTGICDIEQYNIYNRGDMYILIQNKVGVLKAGLLRKEGLITSSFEQ